MLTQMDLDILLTYIIDTREPDSAIEVKNSVRYSLTPSREIAPLYFGLEIWLRKIHNSLTWASFICLIRV